MKRPRFPFSLMNARLFIPASFNDCLTYGQRQEYMWQKIQELQSKVEALETKSDEDLTNNEP